LDRLQSQTPGWVWFLLGVAAAALVILMPILWPVAAIGLIVGGVVLYRQGGHGTKRALPAGAIAAGVCPYPIHRFRHCAR
jgi:hypothetical protein